MSPSVTNASIFRDFTGKVKVLFLGDKDAESQDLLVTSQTMALIKPTILEGTTKSSEDQENDLTLSLDAVSGPLRLATEDIDFPLSDEVSVYEVKKGDTLTDVAKLFNVSINTIVWANSLKSKVITPGDTLVILPITGIKHTVKKGDTVATIAKKYRADKDDIAQYNGVLVDASLAQGETIIVPDGEIEAIKTPKAKSSTSKVLNKYATTAPGGFLVRPVLGGRRSQGIHGHNGIDIAATPGTPVLASGSGRVIVAKMGGYNGGYGNMIIISHDKGIQTVYAHLQNIYVSQGATVSQGQTIGEVGNSGRSTGPHLHFEVRGAKNPF
jgi:LysM repeat protein